MRLNDKHLALSTGAIAWLTTSAVGNAETVERTFAEAFFVARRADGSLEIALSPEVVAPAAVQVHARVECLCRRVGLVGRVVILDHVAHRRAVALDDRRQCAARHSLHAALRVLEGTSLRAKAYE